MQQDFVRFMPVLLQIGLPLKVNVYAIDQATGALRIVWARGHVFQPTDLSEVLNPGRRYLVPRAEYEVAIKEIESTPMEIDEEPDGTAYWCG
jgi:hypothetical protein